MNGIVKFFNRKKGFGFITGEDQKDYFVHFTAVQKGVFLRDNDKVSFDAVEGDRGMKAENVQLVEKASESAGGEARVFKKGDEESSEETSSTEEY